MKKILYIVLILATSIPLFSQEKINTVEGVISYQSTQNCYVRFESTEGIEVGDTLFVNRDGQLSPALTVVYLSSISCAGKPLDNELKVGQSIIAKTDPKKVAPIKKLKQETDTNLNEHPALNAEKKHEGEVGEKQRIDGRISAISYLNLSNTANQGYQKLRYNASLNARNIANTGLSFESFASFTHRLDNWSEIQSDIFNGLKIYDLSLSYKFSKKTNILLGRNINPSLSSMGAIDGLQFRTGFKQFFAGAVVGFRPDYTNYSFNSKLLEYGGYIGHSYLKGKQHIESTLAFIQQTNNGNIDRRFGYFQTSVSAIKNLKIFFSTEVDLYKNVDSVITNSPSLTSLFVNINYRPIPKLTLNVSFDSRKNVIYYETFKNQIDQLLEDATRQGVQFRANYRLTTKIGFGVNAGYRYRSGDMKATQSANGFLSVYELPFISGSILANANYLSNSYLTGMVYSLNYSRDIIAGKLSADLNFRLVDYDVSQTADTKLQYIGEAGIYWQITRGLSLSSTYEATFEKPNSWGMLYINLSQRF